MSESVNIYLVNPGECISPDHLIVKERYIMAVSTGRIEYYPWERVRKVEILSPPLPDQIVCDYCGSLDHEMQNCPM